jgi:hypothetical protein
MSVVHTKIDEEATRKALRTLHKETIISLYITAKRKADLYDELRDIIKDMVDVNE